MIHVLIEESYVNNNRAELVREGICSVAKKKRIAVETYQNIAELPEGVRVVILICASLKWATDAIELLNERGIHPLLFGFQYIDTMYQYSCITLTYTKTLYLLTKYLLAENPGETAFLGYNEDSMPDRLKLTGVRFATEEAGIPLTVWNNKGDTLACIVEFAKKGGSAKNVVCGNDAVAVLMRSYYPELLENRRICSCSGMKISEFTDPPYPKTTVNYFKAGVRLAELYLFLIKQKEISSTLMTLDMDISVTDGKTIADTGIPSAILYSSRNVDFYGDKNVREVENIENMLLKCDETDLAILRRITKEESYEQIAEYEHLALNTVKYRIHAMLKNAELLSKKELLGYISKYGLVF